MALLTCIIALLCLWEFQVSSSCLHNGKASLAVTIESSIPEVSNDLSSEPSPHQGDLKDVRFLLWTRSNSGDDDYYQLLPDNMTNLVESNFNPFLQTHFMYHGFNDYGLNSWIRHAKTALLSLYDCNVISVDWQTLVPSPWYNFGVENAYRVGNYTANYIDWLNAQTSHDPSQIHIVGHSLGAQAAGLTGHYVTTGQIDRVTGLDPAGPFFYDKDPDQRLDKTSGSFVDVIHTNSGSIPEGCIAMIKDIGHVDFYPDGGHHQPGCDDGHTVVDDWLDLFEGCSHHRAVLVWVESILALSPEMSFTGWPCNDWDTFANGSCPDCGDGCLEMGFHVERGLTGVYYLRTNAESPFARGNQQ
uniref:Putative triacylglycerol lipase n=1 Tax=Crangon crangon TaxID=491138 RepID=A0A2Z4BYA0_CRACN|nr:putative triacylglycerol lipase [Crangon crangon]